MRRWSRDDDLELTPEKPPADRQPPGRVLDYLTGTSERLRSQELRPFAVGLNTEWTSSADALGRRAASTGGDVGLLSVAWPQIPARPVAESALVAPTRPG